MKVTTSSSKCKGPICKIKRYLVVYVYDNHIWDVITRADSEDEAKQKVIKEKLPYVTHSIVKEITIKQAADYDWVDEYVQEWKNQTFKSE